MVVIAAIHVVLKVMIAYDNCEGGAPLLDGYIFPPFVFGFAGPILLSRYQIVVSGAEVVAASLIVLFVVYQIAWQLGAYRRRGPKRDR